MFSMTWPGGIAAITSTAPNSDFADALRPGSASSDSSSRALIRALCRQLMLVTS
jgi:hypothetical protein